ncbi:MAG: tRNA dihydrouridine synthase DusB, partial [Armatimonadetes bacterium]|nr:tRNA dihydrouridine synthase DusB [Armatimonadota bacterium]
MILGPMAGTTNRCFRLLCRRGGAGLVCSEMVSSNALWHGNRKTENLLLRTFEGERPVSIQIFGGDPDIMAAAVEWVEDAGADIIDINMGCAVPKVRRSGSGVELMKDPDRAVAVVRAVVERASAPVTVKFRAGLTDGDRSHLELARRLEDAGVAALALHARTVAQGFDGEADWRAIAELVETVQVPVIGNGDVVRPEDAARMMRETGCAAVMIARGAWGRPWIFAQAAAAIAGREAPPDPSPAERLGVALCHAQMLTQDVGERIALHQVRGQMRHYARGLPRARRFRA